MILNIKKKMKPIVGDKKTVVKFAFLPVRINSVTVVWLEKYYIEYKLCVDSRIYHFQWCNYKYWKELDRWIESKEAD